MPDPEEADLGMARPIVLSPTELAGLHRHAKRIEQEDLEVEAAVRRVHLYADSVCEVALRKAEGNRRDDEQKLKRWKDELFAVVGPSDGSNFWFVQEHGTSAFLRIAAVLNPMRERAENMVSFFTLCLYFSERYLTHLNLCRSFLSTSRPDYRDCFERNQRESARSDKISRSTGSSRTPTWV